MPNRKLRFNQKLIPHSIAMLVTAILVFNPFVDAGHAQSTAPPPVAPPTGTHKLEKPAGPPTRYLPNRAPRREVAYYGMIWGIDSLSVKAVESGELIRFSYRVLNTEKARSLNDKKIDAYLISPAAHARLVVPSLEKVGTLRQINTPEAGKSYWMAFSNPSRIVKRGDRVNVKIGDFQAEGLIVE